MGFFWGGGIHTTLFMYDNAESSLLYVGFLQLQRVVTTTQLRCFSCCRARALGCMGFSTTGPRACTLISCDMQNVDHVPTLVGNGHQMNNGVQRPPLSSREKRFTMYCPCLLWKRLGRITLHVLYMHLSHIIGNLLVSKKIVIFNHMTSYSTQFWLLVS